jgi:hypothetical protein
MLESRKERVRHLYYEEGKSTRDIARIERISIRDISAVIKEEEARKQRHEDDSQKQLEGELSAAAYRLFNQGKTPVEVVIELKLTGPRVFKFYKEYLQLKGLSDVALFCDKIGEDAWAYLDLYQSCNSRGMSNKEIVKAVDIALNELPSADENYFQTRKKVNELAEIEQQLRHGNEALKAKNFSLAKEILDLEAQKHRLTEHCNRRKEELEELLEKKHNIQSMLNKLQRMIFGTIVEAIYFMSKLFETYSQYKAMSRITSF